MRPDRIAVNATYLHRNPSGLSNYCQELLARLFGQQAFDYLAYTRSDVFQAEYSGLIVPAGPRAGPHRSRTLNHLYRLIWQQTGLRLRLRRDRVSMLFSPTVEGLLFPPVRQVITVHDLIPLIFPETSPNWKHYFTCWFPLIIKHSQALICISESTGKDLRNHFDLSDKPVHIIHNGISPARFFPRPPLEIKSRYGYQDYLLFVGDMRPYKNLDGLLRALAGLEINNKLLVCGKKEKRFYLRIRELVKELGLRNRVVFLDYVPDEILPALYSGALALIFPSRYEGFGMPVLEAMACGCPVVAARVASLPEVGGDAVLYVDPDDPEEIGRGIKQVVESKELRDGLRAKGLRRARRFSWERSATAHQAVFKEVLGRQQQR